LNQVTHHAASTSAGVGDNEDEVPHHIEDGAHVVTTFSQRDIEKKKLSDRISWTKKKSSTDAAYSNQAPE
jgi:hypothetical protein